MKNLSEIENILLTRATERLNKEVYAHLNEIKRLIFNAYGYSDLNTHLNITQERDTELETWFNELKLHSTYYYGGNHLTFPYIKLPEFIKEKILQKEIKEFLSKVEEIREISE